MGRPPRLSRDAICDAAFALVVETGGADFTLRDLGNRLGVDATAVYRHFADKDDLLREVGDRSMAPVTRGFTITDDPAEDIRWLCSRLRSALIKSPVSLSIVAAGPTRRRNELLITEVVVGALRRMGLGNSRAVIAYHALIEYTLGSAWLDAPLAAKGARRSATYRAWRRDYASLDPDEFADTVAVADELYPSSDAVFQAGLNALITGLTRGQ